MKPSCHWSFSLHNGHIFQVPRVAIVHRLDCILKWPQLKQWLFVCKFCEYFEKNIKYSSKWKFDKFGKYCMSSSLSSANFNFPLNSYELMQKKRKSFGFNLDKGNSSFFKICLLKVKKLGFLLLFSTISV